VKGRVAILLGGSLAFWLVLVIPARIFWGTRVVWPSLAAVALCLVPTSVTLLWGQWAARRSPQMQLAAVVFGTMLRMLFVLAGGLAVWYRGPFYPDPAFWMWIVIFYLFTLALEVTLLLARQTPAGTMPG
jgi:hypothetical protein